jgi:SAM-dependent methyltransferase
MLNFRARSCPVCGSSDESRVYAEANIDETKINAFTFASRKLPEYMHPRLIECPACDLVYANPALVHESLATAYEQAAFDSGREASFAARTYGHILARHLDRLPDRHGALDVGTGDGAFLRELVNAGFTNVVGVEPSRAPIEASQPDIRPLIRQELFQADSFAPDSLSLVTCFQTIEHIEDPLGLCRAAWRTLKPGGILFLIGHDRRALSARLLGRKSPIFDIEHLQLFSRQSMSRMLETAGFTEVNVEWVVNRYPLWYWLRLFPMPAKLKQPLLAALKDRWLGRLPIPLAAGNIAGIARKPQGDSGAALRKPAA